MLPELHKVTPNKDRLHQRLLKRVSCYVFLFSLVCQGLPDQTRSPILYKFFPSIEPKVFIKMGMSLPRPSCVLLPFPKAESSNELAMLFIILCQYFDPHLYQLT